MCVTTFDEIVNLTCRFRLLKQLSYEKEEEKEDVSIYMKDIAGKFYRVFEHSVSLWRLIFEKYRMLYFYSICIV